MDESVLLGGVLWLLGIACVTTLVLWARADKRKAAAAEAAGEEPPEPPPDPWWRRPVEDRPF